MAKKEFTDVTIEMCEKQLHFNRVTNETLTKFSERAEKEYKETVKTFIDEVEELDDQRESIEKKIALKTKLVELIEAKDKVSDEDLNKVFETVDEIEKLEEELKPIKARMMELDKDNPIKKYNKMLDEWLAEKVETLLDSITAKEFLKNSTPVDTIKARNLEKYYQLCMVGERQSKIIEEIKNDVADFLNTERGL